MLPSEFPTEIIEKLARFLTLEDKASCSLVCKSWRIIFQDSMYSDMFLNSKYSLHTIVDIFQDNQYSNQYTNNLVQFLHLGTYLNATDGEFRALQNTLRNVKYLHLEGGSLTPNNFKSTAGWFKWRSLRELFISLDTIALSATENKFFEIILCLPLLRRLDFVQTGQGRDWISFSFSNFETMHSRLVHLEHLGLCSNLLILSDTDLERMTKTGPATIINSLKIRSGKTDHRWLYYFARKYPNLRTLDFGSFNYLEENEEHGINTTLLLQTPFQPFQHLRNLNLKYTNCEKECRLICSIIEHYNISLRNVSIKIQPTFRMRFLRHEPYGIHKLITEICMRKSSNTIEYFSIEAIKTNTFQSLDLMDIKYTLHNLIELNILESPASIALDTLLEAAPRLKYFAASYADIKIKGELYNSKKFGLEKFKVGFSKITSDTLRFLSFHCRRLSELNIGGTAVFGNFTIPGCQFIDMTYTRLKSLRSVNTAFIIKDNKKCPENMNITLITRPVKDIHPKQDYDPNVLPINIGGPPITAHYDWIYTGPYCEKKLISKARGSRLEKMFFNYEKKKKIILDKPVAKLLKHDKSILLDIYFSK